MPGLFAASTDNIGPQLKSSIYIDSELDVTATVKESLTVQAEDTRRVCRPGLSKNLSAVLTGAYGAHSPHYLRSAHDCDGSPSALHSKQGILVIRKQ